MKKTFLPGIIAALIVIFALVAFLAPNTIVDEITGTWYTGGQLEDGREWFVEYDFKEGQYTMKTDSDMKDKGTYALTEFYEDGSIIVQKTSLDHNKTYDIAVNRLDEETLLMDGMEMKLKR